VAVAVAICQPFPRRHRRVAPGEKFDSSDFNSAVTSTNGTFTQNHLLAARERTLAVLGAAVSSSGYPLNGGGAGSWEAWWLEHGSLPVPSRTRAYLEALRSWES
jgi:hypothetical protein